MQKFLVWWKRRALLKDYVLKQRQKGRYKKWPDRYPVQDAIKAEIDWRRFQECRDRFIDTGPGHAKFLNADYWLDNALFRAWQLGLHEQEPLKIIDIGAGAGWFPLVCNHFGHECVGTDIISHTELPAVRMFIELADVLGFEQQDLFIEPFRELPNLGTFDLVTCYKIAFNHPKKPDRWGRKEWAFFLDSCSKKLLKGQGAIFLNFNGHLDKHFMTDEIKSDILMLGGEVCYNDVLIKYPKRPRVAPDRFGLSRQPLKDIVN